MKVHYSRMLAVAIAALASVCSAKDLYWWGNGSITWEANGAKAFREATGSETPVQFENGANAIFDSDYFAPQSVQARIGSTLTVGDLLFDLNRDFTVTSTVKRVVSVATFVKKGPGTLFWKPYQADVSIGDNTVRIEEGKLVYEPGSQYFPRHHRWRRKRRNDVRDRKRRRVQRSLAELS